MDTKFTLLNTRVIISHIYQKEIDMAIHYMKKYDYNHNLVFRAIIKANNIVLNRDLYFKKNKPFFKSFSVNGL